MISGRLAREGRQSGASGAALNRDAARHPGKPETEEDAVTAAAALAKAGRFAESLAILMRVLARDREAPGLLYERALTLFDWGRLREALIDFRAADARGFSTFGLHLNLGYACHLLGFTDEAERHVRQAVALDNAAAIGHVGLGALLQGAKRYDEAIDSFERGYALDPSRTDCLMYAASCRIEQKNGPAAEEAIRRALSSLGEEEAKPWGVLGVALSLQDRDDEASVAFERALAIEAANGQPAESFDLYGVHLLGVGRISEALELYARYLPSRPDPRAQTHNAWALLTAGRLREGWEQYEFRWCEEPSLSARRFAGPQWRGQSLEGKTVVVWAEQGIGDTVHFARFARALKERGATVVLHVPERLKELAQHFSGVDRVIVDPSELAGRFDYQIATMSLPRVLGIELDSIPADVPYLTVDAARAQRWRTELAAESRLQVGLVWAGNPRHERDRFRSIAFEKLAPLWRVEGVQFYSLQKEHVFGASLPADVPVIDLAPRLDHLLDTAAAIQALDLVICVDTAVAHIAGALGRPVWLMLPAAGDFRWLTGREDSPWYPTMRLFTQRTLGEWDEVVARIATALSGAAKTPGAGLVPDVRQRRPLATAAHTEPDGSLSRVAETRLGLIQYLPTEVNLARALDSYGEWLQPQIELMSRLLKPGATVIEANSGIGVHALALAQALGPQGHVFAYEPDPIVHRILVQNLQMNGVRPLVTVMQRELTSREACRSTEDASPRLPDGNVPANDMIDELMLERLDLVKVNDRSDPRRILDGGETTIWRCRPMLFLEQSRLLSLGALAEHAKRFSYRCWEVITPLFSQGNYNRRSEDVFEGEVASALLAVPEEAEVHDALRTCKEV